MQVNISDTRTLRETCGLCGTTVGVLLYRNGNTANIMNRTEVDAFANSYLVAPRDQFLHPQRRECGKYILKLYMRREPGIFFHVRTLKGREG